MGYDGGFTKIGIRMENQLVVDDYEQNIREKLYDVIKEEAFHKFESPAVDLGYLDNSWTQVRCLRDVMGDNPIKDYDSDDNKYTLITKEILKEYISKVKIDYNENIIKYGEDDEENKMYLEDILSLENLYKNFDWDKNTLVFSYSY